VTRFEKQIESCKNFNYNETQTRRDFIDPLFKALGWDIKNEEGYAEAYREVIHEDKVKISRATKAFRMCFVYILFDKLNHNGLKRFFIHLLHKQKQTMPFSDEKTLVLGLQKGNILAFEKIFSLYHKRIYNFCLHLYQTSEEAQETVQKVFIALWEQRAQVNENKPLASYLDTIARYMVYQEFRYQVYKKAAYDQLVMKSSDYNETTKDDVLYNELLSFLESVIEELPERQREIFKLSRFSGLTYKQIADKLNISENTVDTQIRRALDFIRDKYKTHYN